MNHSNGIILPNVGRLKISIDDKDLKRLEKFDQFLNKQVNGITYPLIFNDDSNSFKQNREISYAFKKQDKSIYQRSNVENFEFEIIKDKVIPKWSQIVGALKNSPQQQQKIIKSIVNVSNALQPLGIVSLKMMYDKSFNLFETSDNKITPHGLINTGNICYMNSILQMLLYCPPFNEVLRIVQSKTIANLSGQTRTPLLDATILFMNEFTKPDVDTILSPENFYHALSVHPRFSHLKWGQQEDLEEFLGYLLDGLHEEFVDSIKILSRDEIETLMKSIKDLHLKNLINNAIEIVNKSKNSDEVHEKLHDDDDGWHEVGANKKIAAKRTVEIKPSPITLLFGGQFRSVLEVPKQKESKSITLDPFQHVQLDISDPRVETLQDLFKLFTEPEFLPYKSSNGTEVLAKKQNFIDKLPNILIIHLKRFSFVKKQTSSYKIEKLRKKIIYSHDLEIPIECISYDSQKDTNYKLIGVVYHHGISPEGGHYTCDVRKQNEWIRIDDGNISGLDEKDVLDNNDDVRNAYILMYQRV